MPTKHSRKLFAHATVAALLAALIPFSLVQAGKEFRAAHSADPQGSVEIVGVNGRIELSGWDRSEVEVTGISDEFIERVRMTTDRNQTLIHINPGSEGGASRLVIRVPARSSVSASLVSATLKVSGILGDVNLRTVSGDISGEVGGDLRAHTATGTVKMTARQAKSIEVKTISGDVQLTGGSGEVEVTTVSGNAKIDLGTLTRGRFKTVSGNLTTNLGLAPDGELDGESISGTMVFEFTSQPAANFDVQSFSGNIDNCFGPKAEKAQYGPGSRLEFRSGAGRARVRIETKSGNVNFCARDAHESAAARGDPAAVHRDGAAAPAPVADCRERPYIFYAI
jgi:putative adhesin